MDFFIVLVLVLLMFLVVLYGIKGVRLLDFIVYCPAGRALRGLIEALLRISRDLNEPGGSFKKFSPYASGGYHCSFGLYQTQYGWDRL